MYSVYQHWDPLKTCVVGRTYTPEFYQWIADADTRKRFEKDKIHKKYLALYKKINY